MCWRNSVRPFLRIEGGRALLDVACQPDNGISHWATTWYRILDYGVCCHYDVVCDHVSTCTVQCVLSIGTARHFSGLQGTCVLYGVIQRCAISFSILNVYTQFYIETFHWVRGCCSGSIYWPIIVNSILHVCCYYILLWLSRMLIPPRGTTLFNNISCCAFISWPVYII